MAKYERGGITFNERNGELFAEVPIDPNMDPEQVDVRLRALGPRRHGVVGNYADLQRLGAKLASEDRADASDVAEAFVPPPGTDAEEIGEDGTGVRAS